VSAPYSLVAELSYKCPLACAYCSNPLDFTAYREELATMEWARVFREAAALGVVQLHLSGGEPLVRRDLEALVGAAHDAKLYTHLVTSGIPLDAERLDALVRSGLDAVQLSLQGTNEDVTEKIAGLRCHARKLEVARAVRAAGLPLTINVVLHRHNAHDVRAIIALAASLGARRVELANVQFLGWALKNRAALMPDDVEDVRAAADEARATHAGKMEIVLVLPDYHRGRPRACMGGWAASTIVVTPAGTALPCHAAASIASLEFPSVREHALEWIWLKSAAFNAFRGEEWMQDPCKSCPERERDFGGCRCQAFALTGDASRTDPACELSPDHPIVRDATLVRSDRIALRRAT